MKMGQLQGLALFESNRNKQKPNPEMLAGGSKSKFRFQGETVVKKCRCYEVEAFQAVFQTYQYLTNIVDFQKLPEKYDDELKHLCFYRGLRPFVVKYLGYSRPNHELFDDSSSDDEEKFNIKLSNMLYKQVDDRPYSFLDLKMGTDCVLKTPASKDYKKYKDRDKNTTTE